MFNCYYDKKKYSQMEVDFKKLYVIFHFSESFCVFQDQYTYPVWYSTLIDLTQEEHKTRMVFYRIMLKNE